MSADRGRGVWRFLALVVLVLFVGLSLLAIAGCRSDPAAARKSASEFVRHIPGQTGFECAETDSDGDGYCSCTVFRGDLEPMQIQCGCQNLCVWNCASGCKYTPTIKVQGGRVR